MHAIPFARGRARYCYSPRPWINAPLHAGEEMRHAPTTVGGQTELMSARITQASRKRLVLERRAQAQCSRTR